jgi:GT2 family glycosyltransferase
MTVEPTQISVLFATRDRAESLERLLESLDRLRPPPTTWEIVVADNGSSDETPSILARWGARSRGRTVVRVAERGKARAINAAIAASKGELLAFIDDDVRVAPEWLEEIWRYFDQYDVVAAQGAIDWPPEVEADPALQRELEKFGTIVRVAHGAPENDQRLTGANMILRRQALNLVGGFDERLGPGAAGTGEDTELGERLVRVGGRIGYIETARVVHEIDRARLTERYFAEHHRRLGRSRFTYKGNGVLSSILPNLALAAFRFCFYTVTGNEREKYRAKGRLYHYGVMLDLRRQAGRATPPR